VRAALEILDRSQAGYEDENPGNSEDRVCCHAYPHASEVQLGPLKQHRLMSRCREILTGSLPSVSRTDLLDLLLDADEVTRNRLIFKALQTGALKKSEAEEVVASVWIERAADSFWVKVQAEARAA
jgi:hypothetical protein